MPQFTQIIEDHKADLEAINQALAAKDVGTVSRFSEIAEKIRGIEAGKEVTIQLSISQFFNHPVQFVDSKGGVTQCTKQDKSVTLMTGTYNCKLLDSSSLDSFFINIEDDQSDRLQSKYSEYENDCHIIKDISITPHIIKMTMHLSNEPAI